MAKEHFFYRETEPLFKKLELLSRRSGVSRGQAFICGNSLSGAMQFAYRIGHFYHEGPNGRRRGVIRDVPPEETLVPVIATRLRRESADLFQQSEQVEPQPEALPQVGLPTIIEVPQWLARLEPQLAALDRGETAQPASPREKPSSRTIQQPESPPGVQPRDDRPPEQQELF